METTTMPLSPMAARTSVRSAKLTSAASLPLTSVADVVLEEIRTHLGAGRYRAAQRLAAEATAQFPDHPGLGTTNQGLNEWQATTQPANGHNRTEEFAWLRNPPEPACGKLVALVGSEVVAAADTMAELGELLKSM